MFYLEPFATQDLDVFVALPAGPGRLVSLAPLYAAGTASAHIRFGKALLQVLTDTIALVAEAMLETVPTEFDGVPTRVMASEYLCAIALETGWGKDFERVAWFIEQDAVDVVALAGLLSRHDLLDRRPKVRNWPEGGPHALP